MTIFDHEPADWKELQNMVGQLFAEMSCEVEVSKVIGHPRGAKEIDVYVRDAGVVPPAVFLCECKKWQRAVPQEVVHSFRTVMVDIGAHRGFIISMAGFQEGARQAAANTNIDLITFIDLQKVFFDRWRINMGERYARLGDKLFPYWDYPGRMPTFQWSKSHGERQHALMEAYRPLIQLGFSARLAGFRKEFPVVLPALNKLGHFDGEVTINSYRQLYDFIDANMDDALYHFQVLHGEVRPNRAKGEYDPRA